MSSAPALAQGAELIGLGRSIYAVLDRRLVDHALENIRQRLQRGFADPSTQFVTTTPAGQLLRVQMAPVRGSEIGGAAASELGGFVLMFDNITQVLAEEALRDKLLQGLTDRSRASLANIQAAIEMLDYPDLDSALRARFQTVIRDEVRAMGQRIQRSGRTHRARPEDALAARRHARRRPGVSHRAAHRGDCTTCRWARATSTRRCG